MLSNSIKSSAVFSQVLHCGANLSDHNAIEIILDVPTSNTASNQTLTTPSRLQWDRATPENVIAYQQLLNEQVYNISVPDDLLMCNDHKCKRINHIKAMDNICSQIVSACIASADLTIPNSGTQTTSSRTKCVPGWKEHVQPLQHDAIFWHSIWISCGSPSFGAVAEVRRRTRALYHRAIHLVKKHSK